MKKAVIFLFLVMSLSAYSQRDIWHDAADISGDDSTYFIRVGLFTSPGLIQFDFTTLSHTDSKLTIYGALIDDVNGDTIPTLLDNLNIGTSLFPITLNNLPGSDYMDVINEDTTYSFALDIPRLKFQLLVYKWTLESVDTGYLKVRYRK